MSQMMMSVKWDLIMDDENEHMNFSGCEKGRVGIKGTRFVQRS